MDCSAPLHPQPIFINSDDGSITDGEGNAIRRPGVGLLDGISFDLVPLAGDPESVAGVFGMDSLDVREAVSLIGTGSHPLILLVEGQATLAGTVDLGARRAEDALDYEGSTIPGPGGFAGGEPGAAGLGPCPGLGAGGLLCGEGTTAGGGGGGGIGSGGSGGPGADPRRGCDEVFPGGEGGSICGDATVLPLAGGSGGGGGGAAREASSSNPGRGGAGGGALQISAIEGIILLAGATITAGGGGGDGGGGAEGDVGGGGGGGAGGTILLESWSILVDQGAHIFASGGGGGSGDCV